MSRFGTPGRGVVGLVGAMALLWATAATADQETRFQDWKLLCEDTGPVAARSCLITQKVMNEKSGTEILAVAIGFPKGGKVPAMAINLAAKVDPSVPAIDPKGGLSLGIDKKRPRTTGFQRCTDAVCSAQAPLPDDLLAELKGGKEILLTFKLQDVDKRTGVKMSLKGFGAAYKALTDKRKKT